MTLMMSLIKIKEIFWPRGIHRKEFPHLSIQTYFKLYLFTCKPPLARFDTHPGEEDRTFHQGLPTQLPGQVPRATSTTIGTAIP